MIKLSDPTDERSNQPSFESMIYRSNQMRRLNGKLGIKENYLVILPKNIDIF